MKSSILRSRLMIITVSIAAMAAGLLALAACAATTNVVGTGPMVERDFEVQGFNSIDVRGGYVIVWQESSDFTVTVSMQENLFEYLEVSVSGGALHVDSTRGFTVTSINTPRIYVSSPYLSGIVARGAVSASGWDTITGQSFRITAYGAANLNLDFDVESLEISADGAVSLNLTGSVLDASIELNGAGNVNIAVENTLDVTLRGAGRVRYTGSPTVTRSITGVGTVRQAD